MNYHLDVRDFRFFLAVGEELHFRRAAERLRIAQPHLSQHIRQLEERVGAKLFDRTTRSVKLTHAGVQFLERARFVLAQIEDAVVSTRRSAEGEQGHVSIGFVEPATLRMLPEILQEFRRLYPNVGMSLTNDGTGGQVQKLLEGRIHVAFLRLPIHTRRVNTLTLAREGLVAALPMGHSLATRGSLRLEELAGEDFIQFSPVLGVDFQEYAISYCHRAGFTPRVAYEAAHTPSLLTFVAAGFGIAIVPEYVRHMISNPKIAYASLPEIPPIVDLGLAWLPGDPSPAQKAFRDLVGRWLRDNPVA
jgi:DNA-binding transcriptional LysR family regulator